MAELGRLDAQVLIVGGGTMGADVAVVLRRGGYAVTVLEQQAERRAGLRERFA